MGATQLQAVPVWRRLPRCRGPCWRAAPSCCCSWPAPWRRRRSRPIRRPDSTSHTLLKPPSWAHPFGTDNFGRDILSRTIWAAQIDLQIALFATMFPAVFGTMVGAVLGYVGGWADAVFRRVLDIFVTIPFLVLVIAIIAVLGPGLRNMYIAMSAW